MTPQPTPDTAYERSEHWITFLVTGPQGLMEKATVELSRAEINLRDETHVPYLQAQLAAIQRVQWDRHLQGWKLHWFGVHACDWSESINQFNGVRR